MNKEQMINSLIKNGFKEETVLGYNDTEVKVYCNGEFTVSFDEEEIRDLIRSFNLGARICLMNVTEYDEDTCKILLQDNVSDGFWISENINDMYDQIAEEVELDFEFIYEQEE